MYELVYGDIFDRKCDLLIIPCNTYGGTTAGILQSLMVNELPVPVGKIRAGEVAFEPAPRDFTNAQVIGFAASVGGRSSGSSRENLHSIAGQVMEFCEKIGLHCVNMPLLGTGAGGLRPEESFDIFRSRFERHKSIVLNIFAYSEGVYSRLAEQKDTVEQAVKSPRVFISYSRDDHGNMEWVKELALRLIKNGVDARIDQFHLRLGQDLPQWMTNEVAMADKVLLICDKHYVKKADSRNGGVGWETMIIQGDMMAHPDSSKYICIVREPQFDEGMPIYTRSKLALHCKGPAIPDDDFNDLLKNLFDCQELPPQGEIPVFIRQLLHQKAAR